MDATFQEPTTFGPKELHKRKRTKRQRQHIVSENPKNDDHCNEEEDMARLLMLLAGGGRKIIKNSDEEEEEEHGNDQNDPKFSSKRYVEDSGNFVYQCKTCDKSFSSFQALGGHRASHKKPRTAGSDDRRPSPLDSPTAAAGSGSGGMCLSDDGPLPFDFPTAAVQKPPPVVKVHECSICGAEFSSGQALGGHMRRHRPPQIASSSSLTPPTPESEEPARDKFGSSPSTLDLDLNLPAPDDDRESGPVLSFGSRVTDRSGLLSIAGLVGCHY